MRRFSSRLTSGRRSTPRTTLKIAALAPMPSASVRITVIARPLVCARERRATFRSRSIRSAAGIVVRPPGNSRIQRGSQCRHLYHNECRILHYGRTSRVLVRLEARRIPEWEQVKLFVSVLWRFPQRKRLLGCPVLGRDCRGDGQQFYEDPVGYPPELRPPCACGNYLVVSRRLRVITLTRASGQAGFCDFDLDAVVFVWPLGCGWDEGDLVIRGRIRNAFLQKGGDIVVEVESETAALGRNHRQTQIAGFDLAGLADSFDEFLVERGAADRLAIAQRIDTVECDAGLAQLGREIHNMPEHHRLQFGIEVHVWAREQRPSG